MKMLARNLQNFSRRSLTMDTNRTTAEIAKTCEICGQPIPKARLEAVPGVTMCVQCASKNPGRIDARKYDLSEASPINRNGFAPKD
jgi:phage/conjugal plasmid C-4 type zinc finger TraR family protein